MNNQRVPYDIIYTSTDGTKTVIQVKASQAKSKNTNTCTKKERDRLKKYSTI
jgi:hypothetical protein